MKRIIAAAVIWFIQAVDVDIEKDGEIITITVEFFGKPVVSKTIPIRRLT